MYAISHTLIGHLTGGIVSPTTLYDRTSPSPIPCPSPQHVLIALIDLTNDSRSLKTEWDNANCN